MFKSKKEIYIKNVVKEMNQIPQLNIFTKEEKKLIGEISWNADKEDPVLIVAFSPEGVDDVRERNQNVQIPVSISTALAISGQQQLDTNNESSLVFAFRNGSDLNRAIRNVKVTCPWANRRAINTPGSQSHLVLANWIVIQNVDEESTLPFVEDIEETCFYSPF